MSVNSSSAPSMASSSASSASSAPKRPALKWSLRPTRAGTAAADSGNPAPYDVSIHQIDGYPNAVQWEVHRRGGTSVPPWEALLLSRKDKTGSSIPRIATVRPRSGALPGDNDAATNRAVVAEQRDAFSLIVWVYPAAEDSKYRWILSDYVEVRHTTDLKGTATWHHTVNTIDTECIKPHAKDEAVPFADDYCWVKDLLHKLRQNNLEPAGHAPRLPKNSAIARGRKRQSRSGGQRSKKRSRVEARASESVAPPAVEDSAEVAGEEDGAEVTGGEDGSEVTGEEDGAEVAGREDGAEVAGEEDGAEVTGQEDDAEVTGDMGRAAENGPPNNHDDVGITDNRASGAAEAGVAQPPEPSGSAKSLISRLRSRELLLGAYRTFGWVDDWRQAVGGLGEEEVPNEASSNKAKEPPNNELLNDELPNDELPSDELPNDELLTDELLTDELLTDELPNDELPNDELPNDDRPPSAAPESETRHNPALAEDPEAASSPPFDWLANSPRVDAWTVQMDNPVPHIEVLEDNYSVEELLAKL